MVEPPKYFFLIFYFFSHTSYWDIIYIEKNESFLDTFFSHICKSLHLANSWLRVHGIFNKAIINMCPTFLLSFFKYFNAISHFFLWWTPSVWNFMLPYFYQHDNYCLHKFTYCIGYQFGCHILLHIYPGCYPENILKLEKTLLCHVSPC